MNVGNTKLLLGIVVSIIMLPTYAATLPFQGLSDMPKSFFGVSTGHGRSDFSADGADDVTARDKSYRIFSGIEINENMSMELGFIDFGETKAHYATYNQTDRRESRAVYASLVAESSSDVLKIVGRVGLDRWRSRCTSIVTAGGVPDYGEGSRDGYATHYGVGLDFKLADNLSIRADWQRFKKIGDGITVTYESLPSMTLSGGDINVFDVGLVLKF